MSPGSKQAANRPADDAPIGAIVPAARSPWGHRIMFLLLTTMAFVLFAPGVLLPLLRDHADVLVEEQRLAEQVRTLHEEIRRQERLVQEFQNDPDVNERLAQLDLNYQRPGEEIVRVAPPPTMSSGRDEPESTEPPLVPKDWPAWTHRVEAWSRQKGLIAMYLDSGIRAVLLLMAGGLVTAAFVLYPPRPQRFVRTGRSR